MTSNNVTISEFARQIGLSRARLYALETRGKGPPRTRNGKIDLEVGLNWHRERQERMAAWQREMPLRLRAGAAARQTVQNLTAKPEMRGSKKERRRIPGQARVACTGATGAAPLQQAERAD